MDISVRIETKTIRFFARHAPILQRFRKHHIFPLVKIVRAVADDSEIVNIYMAMLEKKDGYAHCLVARQIEIIRDRRSQPISEPTFQIPFWMN